MKDSLPRALDLPKYHSAAVYDSIVFLAKWICVQCTSTKLRPLCHFSYS